MITVDGQYELGLHDGDRVIVEASPHVSRFARVQTPDYFYRTLMDRLDPGSRHGD
jgi:NAD kinase